MAGEVYVGLVTLDSKATTAGRVVAPVAGAAIASVTPGVAGLWEIQVYVAVGAGGLAVDAVNMQLQKGAGVILILPNPSVGSAGPWYYLINLVVADAISVNAIAAATAAVPYGASIVATQIK